MSSDPGSTSGRVFQINVSSGGVPKRSVPEAETTYLGIVGDRQGNIELHGGAERALCLFSLECILGLQAEGHPIYPGAIGENLTIAGLDWELAVPGIRLRIGPSVLVEISSYTSPCKNIASALSGGELNRVSQKIHPGWSRVYARVVKPGTMKVGDVIVLEAVTE